ncbi:hypothetical protein HHI36_018644 [Cryptolaemus montrouzieri]|uniref:Uncharacterized protein n=1 Tax=Cryptolaemus montrouzieri TaxID=559131 RepID=A0ABD2P185_9CUCU
MKSFPIISLPDDDGTTNWGDLVHGNRQSGDSLIVRDLIIYPTVNSLDLHIDYNPAFRNHRNITSVRFINVGRQRAFCVEIYIYYYGIEVDLIIPAFKDVRVFLEVYGF